MIAYRYVREAHHIQKITSHLDVARVAFGGSVHTCSNYVGRTLSPAVCSRLAVNELTGAMTHMTTTWTKLELAASIMEAGNIARTCSSSSSTESHLLPLLFGVDGCSFASDGIPLVPAGYSSSFKCHTPALDLSETLKQTLSVPEAAFSHASREAFFRGL